jgi:hypothetical protein
MMFALRFRMSAVLVAGLALLVGCGSDDKPKKSGDKDGKSTSATESGHNLGGWWCGEHGLPEDECSLCSAAYAKACKDKGDWCEEHGRAKSQCFKCDPSLKEKFAAIYRKKEGKDPPPVEDY